MFNCHEYDTYTEYAYYYMDPQCTIMCTIPRKETIECETLEKLLIFQELQKGLSHYSSES